MLALVVSAFLGFSPPGPVKDSVQFYTLKPNEVMVMFDEHTVLHTSTGPLYVFTTFVRNQGYFIRTSDRRNFGPFESLGSRYFQDGLWWVTSNGKAYCMDLIAGKKIGPFGSMNNETWRLGSDAVIFEQTLVKDFHFLNVNGKLHPVGYHKDSASYSAEMLQRPDGRWLVSYSVYASNGSGVVKSDSLLVYHEPPAKPEPVLTLKSGRYQAGSSCRMDSLMMDDKFYSMVYKDALPSDYSSLEDGYTYLPNGDVLHAECTTDSVTVFRNKKKIISFPKGRYRALNILNGRARLDSDYVLERRKTVLPGESDSDLWFSNGEKYFAGDSYANITFNGQVIGKGYHLFHQESTNAFNWITIHGRSFYYVTMRCDD